MRFLFQSALAVSFLVAAAGCTRKPVAVVGDASPLNTPHGIAFKSAGAPAGQVIQQFDQTLDHFDPTNLTTFKQRFVIDSSAASSPAAPVLYYVCGEGNCMTGELGPKTWAAMLASQMGAHLVGLEHRYYGQSQPFDQMTGDTMKYLSIEQAIEDLVTFQKWVVSTQGFTGKWITIGGSYPASLAAIYRLEHPELAAGAIASSACARFDQGTIGSDKTAALDAGAACVAKYRELVLDPIEQALGNPVAMAPIKQVFDATDITDDLDFLGTLSGMSVAIIQYGGKGPFCDALNSADPVPAFAAVFNKFVGNFGASGIHLIDWSYEGNMSTDSSKYQAGFGFRQWVYQACTEFGVFTAAVMKANPDTTASLSSILSDPLPEKYCGIYFGIDSPPAIDEMNAKYYDPMLDPSKASNILFVSGNNDPACFPLAIAQENGNATNPNTTTYTVDGGSHCQDMTAPKPTDSASLQGARALEVQLAKQWSAQ